MHVHVHVHLHAHVYVCIPTSGPGLLALPLAFSRCGWVMGSLLLVLVFSLNYVSLHFLLKACLSAREHSYIGLSGRTSVRALSPPSH